MGGLHFFGFFDIITVDPRIPGQGVPRGKGISDEDEDEMRIVFFGSSHGRPEPGRRCSSALIEVGERRYFIDMGTQSIEQLITRGLPPESVAAIFITHMHGDHTNGLLSFLDLCSWTYREADPAVYLPGDAEGTREAIAAWLACNGTRLRPFAFHRVEAGQIYDDGALRVSAYQTKHTEASYAYLVEGEGKRVLFGGDMSHGGPATDFPTEVLEKPLDLAVCESAHFRATEYVPVLGGGRGLGMLCFNHYSPRFLSSVLEAKEALSGEFPVILATDGLEITL